jgi:aldehyde dehydrogenase family 7 protein A1
MAVLSWNAAISMICGNVNIWKGASSTSLCTLAITKILERVFRANGVNPAVVTTVIGSGATIGERLIQDKRISLVSFTGSTSIGRGIATTVHSRFGTTILELGGNNSLIVMDDANLDLVIPAAFFGAIGTAGQRCTSTRRILVHEKVYDEVVARLLKAYGQIRIGNPLDKNTLCGPVHTKGAIKEFTEGIETIKKQGGKILVGGTPVEGPGYFVNPTLVSINHDAPIVKEELFVPIAYIIKFSTFEEAVAINNEVPQGLSSSMFTRNMQNVFRWTGPLGSDCGIINVNAGTSGAEIGGAFGGQKETGGGRESGSDSWKQYMRRGTVTINYGNDLPLAQGIKFEI